MKTTIGLYSPLICMVRSPSDRNQFIPHRVLVDVVYKGSSDDIALVWEYIYNMFDAKFLIFSNDPDAELLRALSENDSIDLIVLPPITSMDTFILEDLCRLENCNIDAIHVTMETAKSLSFKNYNESGRLTS